LLTLALHILFLFGLKHFEPVLLDQPKVEIKDNTVVTQLISQDDFLQQTKKSKIVETEISEEQVSDSEGPVYLGETRQRVKRQMVSSQSGSVEGGAGLLNPDPLNLKRSVENSRNDIQEKDTATGILEDGRGEAARDSKINSMAYGSMDSSDVDAEFGPMTQLNTDEFRFSSFFNRYRRSLYGFWQPTVWKYSSKESLVSDTSYLTKLAMHYSKEGRLEKIVLQTSSGKQALDQAAIDSVKQMGDVQNIPQGLYVESGAAVVPITFAFQLIRSPVEMRVGSSPPRKSIFR